MKPILVIAFLISFFASSTAQPTTYENLVFEGAGIRGIAYAGALQQLETKGVLTQIQKVGGTSAGAITALLVSLGYTSHEIKTIISNTKFQQFNDGQFMFIGGLLRMRSHFGWYRGKKFTSWIESFLREKTGNTDITFQQLKQQGFKDLYITGTCINRQKLIVFSAQSYPHMKVKDALRISMSIPLYFKAVFMDSLGKVYSKPSKDRQLDVMVDGGILANFPIQLFDSIGEVNGAPTRIPNPKTLGCRIDTDEQIQSDKRHHELAPFEVKHVSDYITAFYNLMLETMNRTALTQDDWDRTISISSVGIGPRIKRLGPYQKDSLVNSGFNSTAHFFSMLSSH